MFKGLRCIALCVLCAFLLLLSSGVHAANCKDVHKRYQAKLKDARYESLSMRRFTLDYLKNLEGLFKNCFGTKQGKALAASRAKLAKSKAAPLRKPGDKSSTKASKKTDENQRRRSFETTYRDASSFTVRRRPRISGGSAAMLSLVIPGAGQAVKDQPVAAWLFFLGATICYTAGGAIIGGGASTGRNGLTYNQANVAGGSVLMGLGGLIHLGAIIHAAVAK
jgi:hypothetical protein